MKTKHINMAVCALVMAGASACSNAEYELDRLFPEKYHRIVYIQDETDDGFTVYDMKDQTNLTFNIIKAGSDPQLDADVTLQAATKAELDSLRKDYTLVTPDCYNAPASVHFAPGEEFKEVSVGFNLEALKKFMAADNTGKPVAVALHLAQPSTATINEEKSFIIRTLSIDKPSLEYVTPTLRLGMQENAATISLKLGLDNVWDFSCQLDQSGIAQIVEKYNKDNGTGYELLPSAAYKLSSDKFSFVKGESESSIKLNMTAEAAKLDLGKTYLLPIHLSKSTMEGINLPSEDMFVVVSGKVDITLDMLSSPCTQGDDGAGLPGLIDNNTSTFWQSVWKTQYMNAEFGHYFDVHLTSAFAKELKFAYTTRDYAPILPLEIKISVSADGQKWTTLARLEKDKDGLCDISGRFVSKVYKLSSAVSYIRYSVMKTNNGRPGVDGSASTAITGFELWGR